MGTILTKVNVIGYGNTAEGRYAHVFVAGDGTRQEVEASSTEYSQLASGWIPTLAGYTWDHSYSSDHYDSISGKLDEGMYAANVNGGYDIMLNGRFQNVDSSTIVNNVYTPTT